MNCKNKNCLKIVILGDSFVGKTKLLLQYLSGKWKLSSHSRASPQAIQRNGHKQRWWSWYLSFSAVELTQCAKSLLLSQVLICLCSQNLFLPVVSLLIHFHLPC